MFTKLFRRRNAPVAVKMEQRHLDILRMMYADDQLMQLHFDRLQTSFDAARKI